MGFAYIRWKILEFSYYLLKDSWEKSPNRKNGILECWNVGFKEILSHIN
jgi:hypothetical protein